MCRICLSLFKKSAVIYLKMILKIFPGNNLKTEEKSDRLILTLCQ